MRPKHLVVANNTALIFSNQIQVYSQTQEQSLRIIKFPDGVSASLFSQPIVSKDEKTVGVVVERLESSGIFSKSERLVNRELLIYETETWMLVNTVKLSTSGFVEATFDVDGTRLAVLQDHEVRFYDLK